MPPMGGAPIAGDAAPSAMQMAGMGGGPSNQALQAQQAEMEQFMTQVRNIDTQVKQLAAQMPDLSQEAQVVGQALKQMIVKAAAMAQTQTASAAMLPGGGM